MAGRSTFNLSNVNAKVLREAKKGLTAGGMLLMRDVALVEPKAPLDEGTLRSSGSVFVDGKLKAVSDVQGPDPKPNPATKFQGTSKAGEIKATVVYNVPYAARLHEHPEYNFTEPGTGGKYLSTKLSARGKLYMREVARRIKRGLNGIP